MATTQASGSCRSPQHSPEAQASETPQPPSGNVRGFHASADLKALDQVMTEVDRLRQLGLFHGEFPGRFAKTCRLSIEELCASAIFEITEYLYQRAGEDWARYGSMIRNWENKFKDPNNVLLEAERLNQKIQKQAEQKSAGKKSPKGKVEERAAMKAEAYAHLHAFSAAFDQAWDAVQNLQPHLELRRDELRRIYIRLQQARFETLVVLDELGTDYERTVEHRVRKLKVLWETQKADHLRRQNESEQARWAWEKHQKRQKGRGA